MSVKSLLQLILLLLIILIIGGIYFLYFYESPKLNVNLKPIIENNGNNQTSSLSEVTDREILEEVEKKDENSATASNKKKKYDYKKSKRNIYVY